MALKTCAARVRWGPGHFNFKTKMAHIQFGDDGLLRGFNENKEQVYVWTYDDFERHLNECITPSMYHYMANWVLEHFTKADLWNLSTGAYAPGELEASAVDAYFDERINERIMMHEQELVNLRTQLRLALERESAAIDAMLEENKPFDHTSPIDADYCDFMRGIIARERANVERLECEIHEEEQWRGGHEEGAEFDTDQPH